MCHVQVAWVEMGLVLRDYESQSSKASKQEKHEGLGHAAAAARLARISDEGQACKMPLLRLRSRNAEKPIITRTHRSLCSDASFTTQPVISGWQSRLASSCVLRGAAVEAHKL